MVEQGHIKGLKGISGCLVLECAVGGGFAGDAAGFWEDGCCCQFMQLQGDAFTLLMGMGNVSNGAGWLRRHRVRWWWSGSGSPSSSGRRPMAPRDAPSASDRPFLTRFSFFLPRSEKNL